MPIHAKCKEGWTLLLAQMISSRLPAITHFTRIHTPMIKSHFIASDPTFYFREEELQSLTSDEWEILNTRQRRSYKISH